MDSLNIYQPILPGIFAKHIMFLFSFLKQRPGDLGKVAGDAMQPSNNNTNAVDTFCVTQRALYPLSHFPSIAMHGCREFPSEPNI